MANTKQRKKPVRRPLRVRLKEAEDKMKRAEQRFNTARDRYERLHTKFLKNEQKEKVEAVKTKFKAGKELNAEEMDILRKVM